MKIERVKVKRLAEGEDAGAWKRALEDVAWMAGAKVLKDEPGSSWVRRAELNGRDVVVKCRLLNTVSRQVKAVGGWGQGERQWRAARLLEERGILASRPLVLMHARVEGCRAEILVVEHLAGRTVLELLWNGRGHGSIGASEQHAIAAAVGEGVASLLAVNLWNRDHKPSNLIVLEHEPNGPKVAMIDLVGIRRNMSPGVDDDLLAAQMLFSLLVEAAGCGCPPRRALAVRCLKACLEALEWSSPVRRDRHLVMQGLIQQIQDLIGEHGDPRPKVNPLAAAVG